MKVKKLKELHAMADIIEVPKGANLLMLAKESEVTEEGVGHVIEEMESRFDCDVFIIICPDPSSLKFFHMTEERHAGAPDDETT